MAMSNMRIRNMFLLVTALAVMFLLACGGEKTKPSTIQPSYSEFQIPKLLLQPEDFPKDWRVNQQGNTINAQKVESISSVRIIKISLQISWYRPL